MHIGSDGEALQVLKEAFPTLTFHELPSYDIRYSTRLNTKLKLLLQAPGALSTMRREAKLIEKLHRDHGFVGVVSDNRPAGRISGIPSAYITHQLQIKAGLISSRASALHAKYYNRFDEVWVPDSEALSLSGDLSSRVTSKVRWLGPLSRLKAVPQKKSIPWAAVLSGPEPARTQWENEILKVKDQLPEGGVIVRGKPGESNGDGMVAYMSVDELSQLYADTDIIIARSGYSTLMDLAHLGKKALLVPTPGQTEQEYLAHKNADRPGWLMGVEGKVDYRNSIEQLMKVDAPEALLSAELPKDLFRLFQGKRESGTNP